MWYNVPTGGSYISIGSTYTTPFLTNTTTYYVANYDGTCESARDTVVATVHPLPSVIINPIADYICYSATPVNVTATPGGGTFSGDGMTGNSFNPSAAGLGTHNISYSYSDMYGCSRTVSENVLVYDTLVTTLYDSVLVNIYDTVQVYDTTQIIISDTVYETIYDTAFVTIFDSISVTDTLIIDVTLSAQQPPNNTNTIKAFPNPAKDHIYIDNGNYQLMAGYTIRITNSAGQQVFSSLINQQQFYLDLSLWTGNGTYFIQLYDTNGSLIDVKKIILQ